MEPVFMMSSHAAGVAAAQAIDDNVAVQQVSYAKLSAQLRADGQLLTWAAATASTNGIILDENDAVVEGFLAARPDFERVPVKEIWGAERARSVGATDEDGQVLRVLPQIHDTDGFYAAVLRRRPLAK